MSRYLIERSRPSDLVPLPDAPRVLPSGVATRHLSPSTGDTYALVTLNAETALRRGEPDVLFRELLEASA